MCGGPRASLLLILKVGEAEDQSKGLVWRAIELWKMLDFFFSNLANLVCKGFLSMVKVPECRHRDAEHSNIFKYQIPLNSFGEEVAHYTMLVVRTFFLLKHNLELIALQDVFLSLFPTKNLVREVLGHQKKKKTIKLEISLILVRNIKKNYPVGTRPLTEALKASHLISATRQRSPHLHSYSVRQ